MTSSEMEGWAFRDGLGVVSPRPHVRERFQSMTLMHMTLGALSSIFGAHLSWAFTNWIVERKRKGHPIVVPTLLSVAGVLVLVVAVGVVLSRNTV
jgi:hypothetical protein